MLHHTRAFANRRREATGASAVEHGLLVALIVAVTAVAAFALTGLVQSATTTCDDSTGSTSVTSGGCTP